MVMFELQILDYHHDDHHNDHDHDDNDDDNHDDNHDDDQEAVELLKLTGARVRLKICRYLRGLKFEQLQDGVIHR